jgi:maltooligosyltrehalose trehalohydrolase
MFNNAICLKRVFYLVDRSLFWERRIGNKFMAKVGAIYLKDGQCRFRVWAPLLNQIDVVILAPSPQRVSMQAMGQGYWDATVTGMEPGTRYVYELNGDLQRPDPASHFQPEGVHQSSQVIDHYAFQWSDQAWKGIPLADYIIYEVHIGTFTPEGTFAAVIPRLQRLKELGITAIEIMPVAQFPGDRNWGYDGVYPYAVQNSYGGPDEFKALINACHQMGIAVILDVVYNHVGPEGNYLKDFGPYFTSTYRPGWGEAFNFDDAYCDAVRDFFLENALYWLETFHIDALRLDAIQGIYDLSAKHFLAALAERVADLFDRVGKPLYLTAESDLNDVRVIRPLDVGGYGIDAQWCDDFHHALHTLITHENHAYYQDFGHCEHLAKSLREGFVYSGQYAPHRFRCHGTSSIQEPAQQFIICSQNHDQTGNRLLGERLTQLTTFAGLKLTAAVVLLSPFIPLLFMGEEYGEDTPFFYFISHSDADLINAIKTSKDEEFKKLGMEGESYDPQSPEIFQRCQLQWEKQNVSSHQTLWQFYQHLIQLRRSHPALKNLDKRSLKVTVCEAENVLLMERWADDQHILSMMNFSDQATEINPDLSYLTWQKVLDSSEACWGGEGSCLPTFLSSQSITIPAQGFALYQS